MPHMRLESYQVDLGIDSAACVVSRRHAVASHDVRSASKIREAGLMNDSAVRHRYTGMH
jgi:hypothetical protein